jgi:hypothetical protein
VIRITPRKQRYASVSALACGSRLATMQRVIVKVAVHPASLLPVQGIPVGLRRVLACSCADCRDAAAHRAE